MNKPTKQEMRDAFDLHDDGHNSIEAAAQMAADDLACESHEIFEALGERR